MLKVRIVLELKFHLFWLWANACQLFLSWLSKDFPKQFFCLYCKLDMFSFVNVTLILVTLDRFVR